MPPHKIGTTKTICSVFLFRYIFAHETCSRKRKRQLSFSPAILQQATCLATVSRSIRSFEVKKT